jgi:hypothetical protein
VAELQGLTSKIPIVFTQVSEPVDSGCFCATRGEYQRFPEFRAMAAAAMFRASGLIWIPVRRSGNNLKTPRPAAPHDGSGLAITPARAAA